MANALRLGYYALSPMTQAKSFRDNPVLGSTVLNRLGLHLFRVAAAAAFTRMRRAVLRPMISAADAQALQRDGFVTKRDFLPQGQFQELRAQVETLDASVHTMLEGETVTERIYVDERTLGQLPALRALLEDDERTALMRYASSKNRIPLVFVENLLRRPGDDENEDPQGVPHTDTFHSTIKAWLFLDPVADDNGPFFYVPGSHRLTGRRLQWEYARSCVARRLSDGHSEDGSFRYSERDVDALGMPAARKFIVPANTLVLADTFGVHWRGPAATRSRRRAIWFMCRDNPFNPIMTPAPLLTRRLNDFFVRRHLEREDNQRLSAHTGGGRNGRLSR
ncbi:MAG: phytanoyl-CoA dioxygenase [Chromatiales bacterium]|jgi:hypothetical protein|nr:phytanoyl-CoA dioxygenase [Chromatiales bacterium]